MSRVEEIKNYYSSMESLHPDIQEDISWLINRVEELEEELTKRDVELADRETSHIALYNENKSYKQALEEVLITDEFEDPQDYIDRIVTKASEALGQEK